ncbi:MAG: iron hydrogenase small subunit [Deltaproteobacteria bacterium]|nr:iron hydrogenase small subunit [Deltaproteobacteria bacterium]
MIKGQINGIKVEVEEGTSILDAAKKIQVKIPTLCKHPDLLPTAACGLCIVKIANSPKLPRACCTPMEEGMSITTHDPELVDVRRSVLEMILSNHPSECYICGRSGSCELQNLAAEFSIREQPYPNIVPDISTDVSTGSLALDPRKCITCGRCVQVCQDVQDVWALSFLDRGFDTRISPAGDIQLGDSPCVRCGQCSAHCPTGAILEFDDTPAVWRNLDNPENHCIVQIAPAVRVAIGEAFGYPVGTNLTKKIYTALRMMGFKAIFDTNFGADLTIVEEASEFVERFAHGHGALPLVTSCCPAWIDYLEKYYSDLLEHFSTAKSPHAMVGVLAKTYYAQKMNIDPAKIYSVSVMPCTAKKYEITRSAEMRASGYQDIDEVITTREFARMIKQAGVDFEHVKDGEADNILGDYTGAATIFGNTGGVMEAALRTAYKVVTDSELPDEAMEFQAIRGLEGIKETEVVIAGKSVKIAVASGLGNVSVVLDRVRKAKLEGTESPYHFIEVMACPGGCVAGGGQPYGVTDGLRQARAKGLYADDRSCAKRRSHENPAVQKLYQDFLGKPLSEKSHQLLHTSYTARPLYQR